MAPTTGSAPLPRPAPPPANAARARTSVAPRAAAWLLEHWATVLYVVVGAAIVAWVGRVLFVRQLAMLASRSDYWEHVAALHALIQSPLHPANPHLATTDPSPRFTPGTVLLAVVARVADMDAFQAQALAGTINTALLVVGVYALYKTYFRDPIAPLYGLVAALASWVHGFSYSNVYQLSRLFEVAGYPSTAAVGLTFVTLAVALRALRTPASRGWLVWLGLAMLMVVVTHALTATWAASGVVVFALLEPDVPWRRRWQLVAVVVVACLLAELWPYFSTWHTIRTADDVDTSWLTLGTDAPIDDEPVRKTHSFYKLFPLVRTIGFAALGGYALACFVFTGRHRSILGGALLMLAPFVLNTVIELPLGHRFIQLAIPYLQLGLVWLLLKATPGYREGWWRLMGGPWRRHLALAGVLGLVGTMIAVNIADAYDALDSPNGTRSRRYRLCRAVAAHVGPNAVVLADPTSSWSLPACGPKVVALLHPNPLVPDQRVRRAAVDDFFAENAPNERRARILSQYRVTHVLTDSKTPESVLEFLDERATGLPLRYSYVLHTLSR